MIILIIIAIVIVIAVIGVLSSITLDTQVGKGLGNKYLNDEFGIEPDDNKREKF